MILDNLDRPLAVFDIEATGLNRKMDRIIDLSIIVIHPGGKRVSHYFRVNPEMPIPAESMAIHGITDADVAGKPVIKDVIADIEKAFENADLGGYNLIHFDIPMLEEEYIRCGRKFDIDNRRILDAQKVFHKKEPRDLSAALKYYAGKEHSGAHGAEADVEATIDVIAGQFKMYEDLPTDMDAMHEFCNPRELDWADRKGMLRIQPDGSITINFGKKSGQKLEDLAKNDKSYLNWILRNDFPRDMQGIIEEALKTAQFGNSVIQGDFDKLL